MKSIRIDGNTFLEGVSIEEQLNVISEIILEFISKEPKAANKRSYDLYDFKIRGSNYVHTVAINETVKCIYIQKVSKGD